MEYENMPESSNIEDRRGQGGGGGLAMGGGGLGIGAIIVIFAISYFTGISPQVLMSGAEMVGVGSSKARRRRNRSPRSIRTTRRAIFSPACRRNGGRVEGGAAGADRRPIRARDARHLRRRDPIGLRRRAVGDGAVLLPDRQEGLSRHVVLSRHEDQIRRRRRIRLRLCRRARNRPSRAGSARHSRQGRRPKQQVARPRPTRFR